MIGRLVGLLLVSCLVLLTMEVFVGCVRCVLSFVIVDCGLWRSIEESQQEILPLSLLSLSAHICINLLMYGT